MRHPVSAYPVGPPAGGRISRQFDTDGSKGLSFTCALPRAGVSWLAAKQRDGGAGLRGRLAAAPPSLIICLETPSALACRRDHLPQLSLGEDTLVIERRTKPRQNAVEGKVPAPKRSEGGGRGATRCAATGKHHVPCLP